MLEKQWITVLLCMVSSVATSLVTLTFFPAKEKKTTEDIVRVRRIELIDQNGSTLGVFELEQRKNGKARPRLLMRDSDGRTSIDMEVDDNGNGTLSFASERWNAGAVILGHLDMTGQLVDQQHTNSAIPPGAWGLRVKSPEGENMTTGFANSGQKLEPDAGKPQVDRR